MLFSDVSLIDEKMELREHMYLGTKNEKIQYLSNIPPKDIKEYGDLYHNARNKLIIPGFYNTHSHTPMHLLRGYGENLGLNDWLTKRIFPFENHLKADDIYWACMIGAAEMMRFGIVSTSDMYMNGTALGKAFKSSGIKSNFSVAVVCSDDREFKDMPQYLETQKMLEYFHGYDKDRLKIEFSLHGEYTNTEKIVAGIAEAASNEGLPIHVHVAETEDEVIGCLKRHNGRTPVQYLFDMGLFDVPTIAAHCVHIDENDIKLLKEKQVNVVTCPKSNMKLASGFCPVKSLLKAGLNLSIGTDSVASNNNLNMLEEIKTFALIHKGFSGDATLITPAQALYAATRAGALAQGREDCGLLKLGYRADIVVIDVDRIYMKPKHDLLNNLIYAACGGDIILTMIDGRICYENGNFPNLDIEKLIYETEKSCERILKDLEISSS